MSINPILFSLIPGFALLCNVFLLMTLLTARKNKTIHSFMLLLGAFILWTGGSLLLRLQFYPSPGFWNQICLDGIILVPWLYYLLTINYLEIKGFFLKALWGGGTAVMLVMNHLSLFLSEPVISTDGGQTAMRYETHLLIVLPVLLAICIFISIWRLMLTGLRRQGTPSTHFIPLLVGVGVMLVGNVLPVTTPVLNSLPLDTAACAVNACCIYYAFCKKRLFALSRQIASKGAAYFMTISVSALILLAALPTVQGFLSRHLPALAAYHTVIIAVLLSILVLLLYNLLSVLLNNVFVRDQIAREDGLRAFSDAVGRTLRLDEIIDAFLELLRGAIPTHGVYICLYTPEDNCYRSALGTSPIRRDVTLRGDHPLVMWLGKHSAGLHYTEFTHTSFYKSMWETEKRLLRDLNISYLLPIRCEGRLTGIVLLAEKENHKPYCFEETVFLDSAASVVSIALQNASLYETIRQEAQRDGLTGLYNRRYFTEQLQGEVRKNHGQVLSVILLNLDNFRLYNELYGTGAGDQVLQDFAGLLTQVIGTRGTVARYGGKEFAVLLPFTDAATAQGLTARIREGLHAHISRTGEAVEKFLTFSAGVCTYPTAAHSADELLSYANLAVFSAKQHGRNRTVAYSRSEAGVPPVRDKADIALEYTPTIYALTAAIDAKDHYTFSHSQAVSEYAAALAKAYGLDAEHVETIRQAGLLHDIGKIGIPDAILTKTGRLTDEEYAIIKQHVERSIEMIRHLPSLTYVIPSVLGHHERYDGKGYPRGIAGEQIPVGARCLGVVDSFDAMVSRRSYKEPMPVADALQEIRRNLGTQFDPALGALFVRLVESGAIEVMQY
ncbi:histidine kinase N-terminal 7TM domain-containing diguanylate cyclase/phosphohydrolase [Intestinibacillus massiliensis]|uniref:histidine kinase N-terminal 7TM domain-containing diguanylate cyclase/phosphohydrolase n=1 Tax=Intestinibacillus massiliensis TaxID=1871029 RepID=UPI000B35BA20|nr:HD domain-containing phosphohydrolase [Intestinibacillus massiliensis]